MASTSHGEGSPLLAKRRLSPPRRGRRHASSSSSSQFHHHSHHFHHQSSADETGSILSHVSLDGTPTYGRLVGAHVLSLLPGLALQLATIIVVFHAPCHIDYDSDDRKSDRKICRHLLSDWMSMTAYTLGLVSWLAAYSLRPAIARLTESLASLTRLLYDKIAGTKDAVEDTSAYIDRGTHLPARSTAFFLTSLLTIALRTIALECLRMFGVIVANAVLFANLARLEEDGKIGTTQPTLNRPPWLLQWHDPRLTVGLWVAIGWCTTEFIVSAFQMLDRLSLYKPFFDEDAEIAEAENEEDEESADRTAAMSYTPPASSLTGSQSPGAYLSDSAATVRASTRVVENGQNGEERGGDEDEDKLRKSSPRTRLLEVKRQAALATNNGGQYGDSGISLSRLRDEANEQELIALRVQLDEEVDELIAARLREELQQTLGQPLTEVPIVLCALWRVDGWMWNLTATLLMSASVTLAQGPLFDAISRLMPPFHLIKTTLFTLIALHTLFSSMWSLLMPSLGFAFVTYTSLLAGLGLFVTALARWGLLI